MTAMHALTRRTSTPENAGELLTAMIAVPAGHPSRPALRERAIEAWLPLARNLATRYANRGQPIEDLVQTANEGLIKAVDRFDPIHGVDFVGYAVPTIVGELKRHFRDRTWAIRVPRRLQELRLAITAANNELAQTLCRRPTVADIAVHLRITEEDVLEGLEGALAYSASSLSAPIGVDGLTELGDTLGSEDQGFALAEARIALNSVMARLDERERIVVILRFYGNLTQAEIAGQIGISQMHVSRLIARSLAKLRRQLEADSPMQRFDATTGR